MNTNATKNNDVKSGLSAVRKVALIILLCLLLPGCRNNLNCSGNAKEDCMAKRELLLFMNTTLADAQEQIHRMIGDEGIQINEFAAKIAEHICGKAHTEEDGEPHDALTPMHNIQAADGMRRINITNANLGEKNIIVALPILMRMVIMIFLIVVMF